MEHTDNEHNPAAILPVGAEITEIEVGRAVKRLKPNKAPSIDGIPGEVIVQIHKTNPEVIREVMSRCLTEGCFPSKWKEANRILIPKDKGGGRENQPKKYRPISLISAYGKVLEGIFEERLRGHLKESHCISELQFGFTPGRSTNDAIETALKTIREGMKTAG